MVNTGFGFAAGSAVGDPHPAAERRITRLAGRR